MNKNTNNTNSNQLTVALRALQRASYRGVSVDMLRNCGIASPTGVICHLRNEGIYIVTLDRRERRNYGRGRPAKTRYVLGSSYF